jgi:superfamily I DNA/RNA helicase
VILPLVPDADIPEAVREVGVQPVEVAVPASEDAVVAASREAVAALTEQVEGAIAVIAPARWVLGAGRRHGWGTPGGAGRVTVTDPLTVKGLEYDATVVVDPDEIAAESPGGARVLYVALTRAAHRMHVLRCE